MTVLRIRDAAIAALLALGLGFGVPSVASHYDSKQSVLIAAKTEAFHEKQGFERKPKDIINTLKDNESTSFQTLLDGLQQAFDLDKTLKNKGPYTLFAPSDKAFKKIPDEDVQSLFANKKS